MKMFRRDEGFTLIELMVVVLIIGILVAIAIPVFNSAKANAQRKSCFANERTVEGAAHSFEASTGALPPDGATWDTSGLFSATALNAGGATNAYIAAVPKCPAGGTYSYAVTNGTCKVTCSVTTHGSYQDQ